jgi:aspartyl-tRNA(Asn)/glutamyl-tRNA(Gln) amidotransferase subunit B
MFEGGEAPESIIKKKNLRPIADEELLQNLLNEVMAENPKAVRKIKEGMTKPIDFLIGQVMKKTKGKGNPKRVRELVRKNLPQPD